MNFNSVLTFGDNVTIDGDASLIAKVVAFKYLWAGVPLVEVAYFHSGDQKYALIEETRLTKA